MTIISRLGRSALMIAITCLIFVCSKPSTVHNQAKAAPIDANTPANSSLSSGQNPEDNMPRIKVDDVKKLVAEGKAILIDVRGTDSYKISHIKGALDVPLAKLEDGDFKGLPKDKRIIAYCTCGAEQSSIRAAYLLDKAGFKGTGALLGGMHAWESAGGEMEKAPSSKTAKQK